MQGIESLDNFKNFVSSIGGLGRYEDTYIVHAAEGETVVPMEVFDRNPILKERLFESMRDMGIEPERYIVGNELNSINPVTGQPEFFLKKIFRIYRLCSCYVCRARVWWSNLHSFNNSKNFRSQNFCSKFFFLVLQSIFHDIILR